MGPQLPMPIDCLVLICLAWVICFTFCKQNMTYIIGMHLFFCYFQENEPKTLYCPLSHLPLPLCRVSHWGINGFLYKVQPILSTLSDLYAIQTPVRQKDRQDIMDITMY